MTMRIRVPAGDGAARSATAVTERAGREHPAGDPAESTSDDVAEPGSGQRSGTSNSGRVSTPAARDAKSRTADGTSAKAEEKSSTGSQAEDDQEKRSVNGPGTGRSAAAPGAQAADSDASGDGKEKTGQSKGDAAPAAAKKVADDKPAPEKSPAKPSSADAPAARPSTPAAEAEGTAKSAQEGAAEPAQEGAAKSEADATGEPRAASEPGAAKSEAEPDAEARTQPKQESAAAKSGQPSASTPLAKPSAAEPTASSPASAKPTPASEKPAPSAAPAFEKPAPSAAPASEKPTPAPAKPAQRSSAEAPAKPVQPPAKPTQPGAAAASAAPSVPLPNQEAAKPSEPSAKAARAEAEPEPVERTKQQPLPPVPGEPLKLLAELTNTPPPPPTLLRSAVRRIKIWTPLVALLAIIFVVVQAVRPLPSPKLTLTSPASYTFGGAAPSMPWPTEGQAAVEVEGLGGMGAFGPQKPVPTASVAKVMTAYVILRDHPLKHGESGPLIKVDPQAAADVSRENESVVKVTAGQSISEYEALEAIMLPSANNIARLLARWDAGSEAEFAKKMNSAAKDLGMTNTTYTDPSGLDATTVSTAVDQIKLARQAMSNEVFREIVAKPSYKAASGDTYRNYNGLVPLNNTVGIKTGTSTRAGGNLVFAAVKQVGGTTQLIIGAVMGQYKPAIIDTVLAAGRQLIMAAQQSLTSEQVIKKGDVVGYVDDGLGGRTPVVATQDVQAVGWAGLKVDIALNAGSSGVPHSAKAGATVGTLTVGSGPGQVKVPVALQSDLNAPGLGSKLTRIG
ncbi:D-alanyl-D-alanine carboxypeptidase [Streptantibioticus rubrisoli]|uniref:D-alanyl-D-alanine carboxypeptidase n=1 Tax=Streptantibioticus rubrisoli TaxID=1387313 RepID=A0ABT1PCX0_9ACTN|nr:D-alanyl-D-alanine carboxypeptidase [Streptantibioticus rubrisoli]MCQ4042318.1 D-alanyl-D-alanine carboxypeptidase [Streptantibioticus rubrisoli]